MAEGGPPPRLELNLLECPICLEQLRQPKSLPCLHSFCQDCLGTYITKELSDKMATATSFLCPVCGAMATPINQAETKENWAKQFPTNGVIQELIKLQEQSSEALYCTPCQTKGNLINPAKFWCKKMESGFCETCKVDHHDVIHTECDILHITKHDIKRLKQNSSVLRCDQHDEDMVWYCEEHKLFCCNICFLKDHRHCESMTTTKEYYQKLKAGSELTDMQEALRKGVEVMDSLVKDFDEQLQDMVKNQETALQSITDLRQRINKQLDVLQKNCTDKLITLFKDEKKKLKDCLQQCERLKNSMLNTLKSSMKAVEENENTETIVLYQRGQAEVESCKALVTEMKESFTTVNIKHQTDPERLAFDDDALGEIVTEKLSRRFPDRFGYLTSPMLERRVRNLPKLDIKTATDRKSCMYVRIVYLLNNQILVSDEANTKLKLFTDKGQYLDEMITPGKPLDMCLVDDITVAVAVSNPGCVCIVRVADSKLSLSSRISMPGDKGCRGITHINGKFVVSTDTSTAEVYSLTQDGTTELLHQYKCPCFFLSRDPTNEDILVSCQTDVGGDVALSRLSTDKQNIAVTLNGYVRDAAGVTVDREGNIYLCGFTSYNVVQMSSDGGKIRELLTSPGGIHNPVAIACCGDMLAVTSKNTNYIQLFQLY